MARWLVEYWPLLSADLDDPRWGCELPCFHVFPEGEPERWIVQTNANLPPEVQEEAAILIAEALSKILGV
jgi:hypothetical protein